MRLFFSKLGFVHRRLWERDGFYRVALCFGPAPLIGAAMAAIVWGSIFRVQSTAFQPPAWAHYTSPANRDYGSPDAPHPLKPARPLPPLRADGSVIGYDPGWSVTANAVALDMAMEARVSSTPINGFTLDAPAVTMARIREAGPKDEAFVGVASGFLVIRETSTYGIFVRFERPAGPVANCLVRLFVNGERVTSALELGVARQVMQHSRPTWFAFQPGLYRIQWVFGCWHGDEMSDSGEVSVMLADPHGGAPRPLQGTDIVQ